MSRPRFNRRPILGLALVSLLIVAAPLALGKCPDNPRDCQRMASLRYEAVTEFVDDIVKPGEAGNLVFYLYPPASNASAGANVTIEIRPTSSPVAWSTGLKRTFEWEPAEGKPHAEAFAFRVDADAAPGIVEIPYTVTSEGETSNGSVPLEIAASKSLSRNPLATLGGLFPEALLGLVPGIILGGLIVAARVGFRRVLEGRGPEDDEASSPKRPGEP